MGTREPSHRPYKACSAKDRLQPAQVKTEPDVIAIRTLRLPFKIRNMTAYPVTGPDEASTGTLLTS